MRFTVVGRSKLFFLIAGVVFGVTAVGVATAPASLAQQTTVAATVCMPTSSLTITQPVSDSTVTEASVPLAGTVNQANQIEVYIDEIFDHTIPVGVGQTSFSDAIQLAQGTHTIKLVAINICPGPNGSASSVVTYEPPPNTGDGGGTETDTGGSEGGAEPVSSAEDALPALPFVPKEVERTFENVGKWLNIVATYEAPASSSLTLVRATTIAVGGWLLAFGIATTVVQWLGSVLPVFSDMPSTRRTRIIAWAIRALGFFMVLGGLFL